MITSYYHPMTIELQFGINGLYIKTVEEFLDFTFYLDI